MPKVEYAQTALTHDTILRQVHAQESQAASLKELVSIVQSMKLAIDGRLGALAWLAQRTAETAFKEPFKQEVGVPAVVGAAAHPAKVEPSKQTTAQAAKAAGVRAVPMPPKVPGKFTFRLAATKGGR